jgi:hypothetical protein
LLFICFFSRFFLIDRENDDTFPDQIAAICNEIFARSGKLGGGICGTMSLLSAYCGEGNEKVAVFSDRVNAELAVIKLETFSSGG